MFRCDGETLAVALGCRRCACTVFPEPACAVGRADSKAAISPGMTSDISYKILPAADVGVIDSISNSPILPSAPDSVSGDACLIESFWPISSPDRDPAPIYTEPAFTYFTSNSAGLFRFSARHMPAPARMKIMGKRTNEIQWSRVPEIGPLR